MRGAGPIACLSASRYDCCTPSNSLCCPLETTCVVHFLRRRRCRRRQTLYEYVWPKPSTAPQLKSLPTSAMTRTCGMVYLYFHPRDLAISRHYHHYHLLIPQIRTVSAYPTLVHRKHIDADCCCRCRDCDHCRRFPGRPLRQRAIVASRHFSRCCYHCRRCRSDDPREWFLRKHPGRDSLRHDDEKRPRLPRQTTTTTNWNERALVGASGPN